MEHCEVQQLGDGKFRRLYRGDVNQTEDGLDCLNWREVNASQAWNETAWLLGDHNYCRNPDWAEAREFCYVNETQRGFCVVKSCGENTVTSLQTDTLGLHHSHVADASLLVSYQRLFLHFVLSEWHMGALLPTRGILRAY